MFDLILKIALLGVFAFHDRILIPFNQRAFCTGSGRRARCDGINLIAIVALCIHCHGYKRLSGSHSSARNPIFHRNGRFRQIP